METQIEFVGKVGSMALIDKEHNEIDYNIFSRISKDLKPGMIWVSSGATEIGRLDYIRRNGEELSGEINENKTDYSAQGQAILMQNYRNFINPKYSVRQILVEHQHFNDEKKCQHLKEMLLRCAEQNAIPIVNYNDSVSDEETRKFEIQKLKSSKSSIVECVDNDETASQIALLTKAKVLLILTSVDGIYEDFKNPDTLVKKITGKTVDEVLENIDKYEQKCYGASRAGANGAKAKLEYIKNPVKNGTKVIIANSKYGINDILQNKVRCTQIGINL